MDSKLSIVVLQGGVSSDCVEEFLGDSEAGMVLRQYILEDFPILKREAFVNKGANLKGLELVKKNGKFKQGAAAHLKNVHGISVCRGTKSCSSQSLMSAVEGGRIVGTSSRFGQVTMDLRMHGDGSNASFSHVEDACAIEGKCLGGLALGFDLVEKKNRTADPGKTLILDVEDEGNILQSSNIEKGDNNVIIQGDETAILSQVISSTLNESRQDAAQRRDVVLITDHMLIKEDKKAQQAGSNLNLKEGQSRPISVGAN